MRSALCARDGHAVTIRGAIRLYRARANDYRTKRLTEHGRTANTALSWSSDGCLQTKKSKTTVNGFLLGSYEKAPREGVRSALSVSRRI